MTHSFNRSPILSFYDLPDFEQAHQVYLYGEDVKEDLYVFHDYKERQYLPLGMFMRTSNNNFTHGIYSLTYFSCYTITLNKSF
jgi:hypothetical protein